MKNTTTTLFAALFLTCSLGLAIAAQYPPGPGGNCGGAGGSDSLLVRNLQDATVACHPVAGDTVYGLGGVVTGFDKKPTGFSFYIQNNRSGFANGAPFTGVDVFTGGANLAGNLTLGLGDSVVVEYAAVTEFTGGTEVLSPNNNFSAPNIIVRKVAGPSAAHPIPPFHVGTAAELQQLSSNSANAEPWEGCLVRINGPLRVVRNPTTGGIGQGNSFLVVDDIVCPLGTVGPCDTVFVDGQTLTTYGAPDVGTNVAFVRGIYEGRTQNGYIPTGGTAYRLQIRDRFDISDVGRPNVIDAFPVSGTNTVVDSIMVVFDRCLTEIPAEDVRNYVLTSFGTVNSATWLGPNAVDDNRVILAIDNGLADGSTEGLTVQGGVTPAHPNPVAACGGVGPMLTNQSRSFFNGVLTIGDIQAPDPAALAAIPCVDRSRYAGTGSAAGLRLTYRGVVTKAFGPGLVAVQTVGGGARSGILQFAPVAGMEVGRQYLISGAVQEFFEETEATDNVYLRDEGAVALPAPVIKTIPVLRNNTCDAAQNQDTAEDYESMLVRVNQVRVIPFTTPPTNPEPGSGFYITLEQQSPVIDSILVSNYFDSFTYDANPGQVLNVQGIHRYDNRVPASIWRIAPRNNGDIEFKFVDVQDVPGKISFAVFPNPGLRSQVRFGLPRAAVVDLAVFDLAGRKVVEIAKGPFEAGTYTRVWNGRDSRGNAVGAGMFFYRLRVGEETFKIPAVKLE